MFLFSASTISYPTLAYLGALGVLAVSPCRKSSREFSIYRTPENWNYFQPAASVYLGDDREPKAQPSSPFHHRLAKSRCGRPPSRLPDCCPRWRGPEKS